MCDRQVSIRLGKGFWSRGPIPSINWRAADFPSLQAQALGPDNLALLFQAQLELLKQSRAKEAAVAENRARLLAPWGRSFTGCFRDNHSGAFPRCINSCFNSNQQGCVRSRAAATTYETAMRALHVPELVLV